MFYGIYFRDIFTQGISQICQIFFRQMCLCSEFAKFSHRQSFPPYGILNAKQKHLGCKKVRGQSKATLQTGMCDQKL